MNLKGHRLDKVAKSLSIKNDHLWLIRLLAVLNQSANKGPYILAPGDKHPYSLRNTIG